MKPNLPRVTLADVMALDPCWDEERVARYQKGRKDVSLLDILRLRSIPPVDRIWLVTAILQTVPGGPRLNRLLACAYAEQVLHIYEAEHPGDTRVKDCIQTARYAANAAASAAAYSAANAAARSAAYSAANAAAHSAARSAAYSAARADQIRATRKILREEFQC